MNERSKIARMLEEIEYIDMHTHADAQSAFDLGGSILYFVNALDEGDYGSLMELAHGSRYVVPTFGIHPMRAAKTVIDSAHLEKLIKDNDFVGEIGIDHYWIQDRDTYPRQREIFETQLEIVAKYHKIPSIHTKGAEKEVLGLLIKHRVENAIIHWYSGPAELIDGYLEAGCYFTIGPDIFSGSMVYSRIPKEKLLAETDNPTGMPWVVGGEPAGDDIVKVYRALSSKLSVSEPKLVEIIKRNLRVLMDK